MCWVGRWASTLLLLPKHIQVFDGQTNNAYVQFIYGDYMAGWQVELEVTLPGEGRDRVFRVAIKFMAQVSLYALEEALEGRSQQIPMDAVQALDVVMRHMSSMT